MANRERKVEIRVRVLGKKANKIGWKVYPPLVLLNNVGELGEILQRELEGKYGDLYLTFTGIVSSLYLKNQAALHCRGSTMGIK